MILNFFFTLILTLNSSQANELVSCAAAGLVSRLAEAETIIENYWCEPKVGKTQILNDVTNSVQRKYRLTKTSEKAYLAEINLNFVDMRTPGKINAAEILKFSNEERPQIQKCLDKYNSSLKGPDGESLRIKISSRAPRQTIYIKESTFRSRSSSYAEDISCPTVLHEVMHLMGLVDEYKEDSMGYIIDPATHKRKLVQKDAAIPAYDCRAVPNVPSVMNDQNEFIRPRLRYDICECDKSLPREKLENCLRNFGKAPSNSMGAEARSFIELMGNEYELQSGRELTSKNCPVDSKRVTLENQNIRNEPLAPRIGTVTELPTANLLKPAQFRMITNPLCTTKNSHYMQCAAFAYKSSQELSDHQCGDRSKQCKQDASWLN
jgi:hypothetical protein